MDSFKVEKFDTMAPIFPLTRFIYLGFYRAYYPFGNTAAEDFLENCCDNSEPSVLVLGCGDVRSCFYTLWKNFDFSISTAPKRFNGVCFTLNDYSAAILARNIIFFYLCIQLPENISEKKKWLSAMWAIWYCHELYPDHLTILDATLKALLTFSGSLKMWSGEDNPLHQLVQFTSPTSLSEVATVWRMWLNREVRTSRMRQSRRELLDHSLNNTSEYCINFSKDCTYVHGDKREVSRRAAARAPGVMAYVETGSCYAEHILGINLPEKSQTEVNFTMYERQDGKYTYHYGLFPFQSYYHVIEFSPQFMTAIEIPTSNDVYVPSESFKSKPFLANSFQQFALWIQSSARVLKNKDIPITFNCVHQDALFFCQQQMQRNRKYFQNEIVSICKYDIITTSNLMDHLSPANLVVACVPLMKDNGLLITTSMCCRNCTYTGKELLNLCFGFNCQLFPVILGVRCISHEGNYSNPVMINPHLTDLSHEYQTLPQVRTFVWVKVSDAEKLTLSQLPSIQDDNITQALVNMIGTCAYGLLNYGPGTSRPILTPNCIETALGMLKRFVCLSDESTSDYSYWEPLCSVLKNELSPFLHCFQTQALLHNIHAHLTVSEEDCPLCQKKVLASTLGLFCAKINLNGLNGTPFFVAFIHQFASVDSNLLLKEAQEGKEVHIFDCFDAKASKSILRLNFFAPVKLIQRRVTVAMVSIRNKQLNYIETVASAKLRDIQIPWTDYNFCRTDLPILSDLVQTNSLFGTVTSHVCDSHNSETKISLSKATSDALSITKMSIDRISSREVRFHCNSLTFQLNFSYPINYDTLKIKINSKLGGFLIVSCERQPYSLEEERPCFIVSPDHQLSIVPNHLTPRILHSHSLMQLTRRQSNASHLTEHETVELELKRFLQDLFMCTTSYSLVAVSIEANIRCLLVINKVLFDYQHKNPAVDLAFCSVDDFDQINILKKWKSVSHSSHVKQMKLGEAGLKYFKKALVYFSRRTNATLTSPGSNCKYDSLKEFNLENVFTRCVLYFLLCDPDEKLYAEADPNGTLIADYLPNTGGSRCACCYKISFTTKKCARCAEVKYCSKLCQRRHWKMHKRVCSEKAQSEASETPNTSHGTSPGEGLASKTAKCVYCERQSDNLKKCTKCRNVQYCGRDCQAEHWFEHKKVCTINPQVQPPSSDPLEECAYCKKASFGGLKKCAKCRNVQYCSRDCQAEHWSEHKKVCKKTLEAQPGQSVTPSSNSCTYCSKHSANLRKCTKCRIVQYCDRDCQLKHWPEHKTFCIL